VWHRRGVFVLCFHFFGRSVALPKEDAVLVEAAEGLAMKGVQDGDGLLPGRGVEAVFVFLVESGGGRVAVGTVDKKG
jgi:hypothetical protein